MLITDSHLLKTNHTKVLPLGDHSKASEPNVLSGFYRNPTEENTTGIWATLGWKDDTPFPTGIDIQFSTKGQKDSAQQLTLEEIKKLYNIYPEINKKHPVLERYINLDNLPAKNEGATIDPASEELRLDLHLSKKEGALAFIQFSEKDDYNDPEAFIEYLVPECTTDNRFDNRNKLSFHIPFLRNKSVNTDSTLAVKPLSFIIKILTFARNAKTPEEALKTFAKTLKDPLIDAATSSLGKGNYAIRKFDNSLPLKQWKNSLVNVTSDTSKIDFTKKTLLLIHGTFKDSYGTFELLLKSNYKNTGHSFLYHLQKEKIFDQILAFDHPYFWDTVAENQEWLIDNVLEGNTFSHGKLNILAASRGGLLAYQLATGEASSKLNIHKIMSFSSGSSGYMKTVKDLGTMLSFLKIGAPSATTKLITGAISTGLNYIHKQSGLKILNTTENTTLETIYTTPLPEHLQIKIMAADWHKSLVQKRRKWWRILVKGAAALGDLVVQKLLGTQHDWVIGTEKQLEYTKFNTQNITTLEYHCSHGKYFNVGYPKSLKSQSIDIHKEIETFFAETD